MASSASLIRKVDHTGLTVSSIDDSLPFWIDILGLELAYRRDLGGGEAIENIVGVPGAVLSNAMIVAPGGYRVELLEYSAPDDRGMLVQRPCDAGAAHLCFFIDDMEAVLAKVEPAGWLRQGTPQRSPAGVTVAYVRGPDGHTIEFMQPPASQP